MAMYIEILLNLKLPSISMIFSLLHDLACLLIQDKISETLVLSGFSNLVLLYRHHVIAMAGTRVLMAPTALMMVHNPLTVAIGDSDEMRKAIDMLSEVKESIINAYEIRTNLSRTKLAHLMDAETWMNANKAIELGFADGILEDEKRAKTTETYAFSRRAVTNSLLNKVKPKTPVTTQGTSIQALTDRLNLISGGITNV